MEYGTVSKESVLEKIVQATAKSAEEINALIDEKKNKFAGLLTDAGAAIMVAKELGVNVLEKTPPKISALTEGMKNINVSGIVTHAFAPKEFDKNGKKGKLLNIVLSDESGEIRVTLWNDQVDLFEKQKISRGDKITLDNCIVKSFNEKTQLSLGFGGSFLVTEKKETNHTRLADLAAGQNTVDVSGVLERVFEEKSFNSNNKEGKLLTFMLKDDSLSLRCVAWNDAIKEVRKAKEGSAIRIEGAYTKESLNGTELNLGYSARVIVE